MKTKAILRSFLSVIPVIGMGFILNTHEHDAYAHAQVSRANETATYDFSAQQEISPEDELSVSVLSSTVTSTSHSFGISFKTGGEGFRTRKKSYIVACNDPEFYSYINEINTLDKDSREELIQKIENGEEIAPEFSGYVTKISNGQSQGDVVIPRLFTRNSLFYCHIETIDAAAVANWNGIKSITIPKSVIHVGESSFADAPEGIIFNIEYEEAVPEGWDPNWLPEGCVLNTGYDYEGEVSKSDREPSQSGNPEQFGDDNKNYIIGYYPSEGKAYPLVLSYELEEQPGVLHYQEFNLNTRSNANYDSVGALISERNTNLSINISLSDEQHINVETLTIYNIYPQTTTTDNVIVPDVTGSTGYYIKPVLSISHQYNIAEFVDYSFSRISSFANFVAVGMDVDVVQPTIYQTLNNNYYKSNLDNINTGHTVIRYRLTNLNSASYRIVYEGENGLVTKYVPISTPVSYFNFSTSSTNNVVFLFDKNTIGDDFSFDKIREFDVENLSFTLDLFIPDKNAIIARSNATTKFGNISIYHHEVQPSLNLFNVDLFLILLFVGYVAIYAAATTIIFFVKKEKYKNDEFRRVKPAKFFKKAAIGLVGLAFIVFALTFIVLRVTVLSNSIVVFNPADPFIIGFGIVSVLAIGYFVKELVAHVKAEKQRKTAIRLQLDKDVDDDGTH